MNRPLWNKLTPREQQIMGWVKAGEIDRVTADKLGVHRETIKQRVSEIIQKVGAKNRVQAVAILLEEKHRAELSGDQTLLNPPKDNDLRRRALRDFESIHREPVH